MKTQQLIELQRSITQGEWTVLPGGDVCTTLKTEVDFGGTTGKRPVQLLVGKVNNYTTQAPEPVANATAIALVPELIAEVIRLREALGSIATIAAPCMSQEAERGFGYHSAEDKHRVDLNKLIILARESARAALVNDK